METNADADATTSATIALGQRGEELAARYLTRCGYQILIRNWRIADGELRGELDIICQVDGLLVVVEVKTRKTDRYGEPVEAVNHDKATRIRRLSAAFMREAALRVRGIRFDVIGVTMPDVGSPSIRHITGAF